MGFSKAVPGSTSVTAMTAFSVCFCFLRYLITRRIATASSTHATTAITTGTVAPELELFERPRRAKVSEGRFGHWPVSMSPWNSNSMLPSRQLCAIATYWTVSFRYVGEISYLSICVVDLNISDDTAFTKRDYHLDTVTHQGVKLRAHKFFECKL